MVWFQVGCVCNNAELSMEGLRGQPTEGALIAVSLKVSNFLLSWTMILLDQWRSHLFDIDVIGRENGPVACWYKIGPQWPMLSWKGGKPGATGYSSCVCDVNILDFGFCLTPSLTLQMHMHSVRDNFQRMQEWPFNSETKYMVVKCRPRYGQVTHSSIYPDMTCIYYI